MSGDHSDDEPSGLDFARSIARGLAGKTPARRRKKAAERPSTSTDPQFTGAREDPRDPRSLDAAIAELIAEGGWSDELRVHGIFARWRLIVGDDIADHAQPLALIDGRLELQATTTAWATQLRLLAPTLVKRLNEVLGEGTVLVIDVKGPHTPSWKKGRYSVKGRGPRDTYG